MLVQLEGTASWELRRKLNGWAVGDGQPAEARGSWAQVKWCFWGTRPSLGLLDPRVCGGSAGPGCSTDISLLRMVFGLLPICWLFGLICQVLGGLHSSVVCWRLGASLAALRGDSLRVFLLLLFHLLDNFPDLALCSLQQREGGEGTGKRQSQFWRPTGNHLGLGTNLTSPRPLSTTPNSQGKYSSSPHQDYWVQGGVGVGGGRRVHRGGRGRN